MSKQLAEEAVLPQAFVCDGVCSCSVVGTLRKCSMRAEARSWFRNTDPGSPSLTIQERRFSAETRLWLLTLSPWCVWWGMTHNAVRTLSSCVEIMALFCSSHCFSLCWRCVFYFFFWFFFIAGVHFVFSADIITIRRTLCPGVTPVTLFRTVRTPSRPARTWILPTARIRLGLWDSGRMVGLTWRWGAVLFAAVWLHAAAFWASVVFLMILLSCRWRALTCSGGSSSWLSADPHGIRCPSFSGAARRTANSCTWAIRTAGPSTPSTSDGPHEWLFWQCMILWQRSQEEDSRSTLIEKTVLI